MLELQCDVLCVKYMKCFNESIAIGYEDACVMTAVALKLSEQHRGITLYMQFRIWGYVAYTKLSVGVLFPH